MNQIGFLDGNSFALLGLLSGKKHYLRELAETSGLSPSMVHKILLRLVQRKLVLAENQKNRKLFAINYSSPLALVALSLLVINNLLETKAFKKITSLNPKGIYLFGTAASGKITVNSDIDLSVFFISKPDSFKLSNIKRELSNELKKEVQLVVLTPEKIESMEREQVELLNQIKIGSVVLWGEMFD